MKRQIISTLIVTALLSGCASTSSQIEPVFTPVATYSKLSCSSLFKRGKQVGLEIATLSAAIDANSAGNRFALGVGMVFWPAFFIIEGNGDEQDKLATLKGEQISIEDSLLQQDCQLPKPKFRANQSGNHAGA